MYRYGTLALPPQLHARPDLLHLSIPVTLNSCNSSRALRSLCVHPSTSDTCSFQRRASTTPARTRARTPHTATTLLLARLLAVPGLSLAASRLTPCCLSLASSGRPLSPQAAASIPHAQSHSPHRSSFLPAREPAVRSRCCCTRARVSKSSCPCIKV